MLFSWKLVKKEERDEFAGWFKNLSPKPTRLLFTFPQLLKHNDKQLLTKICIRKQPLNNHLYVPNIDQKIWLNSIECRVPCHYWGFPLWFSFSNPRCFFQFDRSCMSCVVKSHASLWICVSTSLRLQSMWTADHFIILMSLVKYTWSLQLSGVFCYKVWSDVLNESLSSKNYNVLNLFLLSTFNAPPISFPTRYNLSLNKCTIQFMVWTSTVSGQELLLRP